MLLFVWLGLAAEKWGISTHLPSIISRDTYERYNMKQIPLTQGKFALVDDEDYEEVMRYEWYPNKKSNTTYAIRNVRVCGKYVGTQRMHRFILDLPRDKHCDHKDGNGLNNTRANIRPCTCRQNHYNQKLSSKNTSGFKGVAWNTRDSKWRAYIKKEGKQIFLGNFFCIVKAAKAYDGKATEIFGEFAKLNFPEGVKV
jgi:hypothetical protein